MTVYPLALVTCTRVFCAAQGNTEVDDKLIAILFEYNLHCNWFDLRSLIAAVSRENCRLKYLQSRPRVQTRLGWNGEDMRAHRHL